MSAKSSTTVNRARSTVGALLVLVIAVSIVVSVVPVPALAAGETTVALSPSSQSVGEGETATYDVVVQNASGGVGAWEFTASLSGTTNAEITDISLHGNPGNTETSVASDGSEAYAKAALANTSATGEVTIATITVRGVSEGSADLSLSIDALGDESGENYVVTGTSGASLTVENAQFEYSNYSVSPTETNESANITASATVTNTGGTEGSISVPLSIDGTEVATQNVTLAPDESQTVTFTYTLDSPADYDVAIGQTSPITVSVNAPPSASVNASTTDAGVNETVTANASNSTDSDGTTDSFQWNVDTGRIIERNGDRVDVRFDEPGQHTIGVTVVDDDGATDNATVTINVTDRSAPNAAFDVAGTPVVGNGSIQLDANASDDNVGITTYEWRVEAPDGTVTNATGIDSAVSLDQVGEYTVTLTVRDGAGNEETTSQTVTVLDPASFDYTYTLNSTEPLTNETVAVTATVNNTGDVEGTTTVALVVDGDVRETVNVTVAGGASEDVVFTTTFDRGDHSVTVNNESTTSVTGLAPANVTVASAVTDSEVLQGETATVNVTVENTGDVAGTRTVTFSLGNETATKSVSVDAGARSNLTLSVPTENISVGDTAYEVDTEDDAATGTVTVLEPANLSVSYALNTTEPLTNESLQVTVTVTNTGDVTGSTPVALVLDGSRIDERTVEVNNESSKEVTFTTAVERGPHTVTVNDLESTDITALAPANLSVSYDVNTTTILTNESVELTATVNNTGDLNGTTTVEFTKNGSVVETRSVTVSGMNSTTVTYIPSLARGTTELSVNKKPSTTVEVLKPADVTVVSQNVTTDTILSTEPVTVMASLNNTGDLNGSTPVELRIDGEVVDTKTVSVPANTVETDGGELVTVRFNETRNWDTYGTHTVSITGFTAQEITVQKPTNSDAAVNITAPESGSVTASGSVSVAYDFENVSTGIDHAEYSVDGSDWKSIANLSAGSLNSTLTDGSHTVEIRLIDNRGEPIGTTSRTFSVDTQAPRTNVSVSGPLGPNAPADILVQSIDANPNATVIEIRDGSTVVNRIDLSDKVAADLAAGDWNATYAYAGLNASGEPLPAGEYTVAVISTDATGQRNESTTTVTVDTDQPTGNVTDVSVGKTTDSVVYVNGSDTITVTGNATDPTSAVDAVTVVLQSQTQVYRQTATASYDSETETWSGTVDVSTLSEDGTYIIGARVRDAADNDAVVGDGSVTVVVDRTAPNVGTTVKQLNATTARVNVTTSEPLEAAPNVTVQRPDGSQVTVQLSETEAGWTGTFEFAGSGSYRMLAAATDRAGNTGEGTVTSRIKTDVDTIDRTATLVNNETGTFIELHTETDVQNAFAALTQSDQPLAELSSNLTGSQFIDGQLGKRLDGNLSYAIIGIPVNESELPEGVEPSDVEIRFYNETTDEWEPVGNTTVEEVEVNGTIRQYYTANVSHFSTYGAVTPDTTAPSIDDSSVTPSESPLAYETETATVQVDYSDSQTGVNASAVKVWVDGTLVSDSTEFDGELQVTENAAEITLQNLVGSGEHTVTVQPVDEAGNLGTKKSRTFTVEPDTTAPSIEVTDPTTSKFEYGTEEVTFDLNLTDTQSGVDKESIEVTLDGTDVTEEATITSSSVTVTATGLEAGTHTLTVSLADAEGNQETIQKNITIAADTTKPTIKSTSLDPAPGGGLLPANTTSISFGVKHADSASGIDPSAITVEFSDGSGWTDVTDAAVITESETTFSAYNLEPGTYSFRMLISDSEGNVREVTKNVTIGSGTAPRIATVDISPTPSDGTLNADTSEVTIQLDITDAEDDIENISATFDGEPVSVTEENGQVTFTATGLDSGTRHTFNVTITDRGENSVNKSVSFDIEDESTSDDGTSGSDDDGTNDVGGSDPVNDGTDDTSDDPGPADNEPVDDANTTNTTETETGNPGTETTDTETETTVTDTAATETTESTATSTTESEIETAATTAPPTTEDSVPGFGPMATLIALLSVFILGLRRGDNS